MSLKAPSARILKTAEAISSRAARHVRSIKFPSVDIESYLKSLGPVKLPSPTRKTSAVIYGAAAAVTFVWLTDWRVVCERIPFYGSKYKRARTYANEPIRWKP